MSPSHLLKLWTEPTRIGHIFRKLSILKIKIFKNIFLLKVSLIVQYSSQKVFFCKDTINFPHWKMTLKIRILKCSRRLLIILVSMTVTLFSEKMLISARLICNFMSNLIKKILKGLYLRSGWVDRGYVSRI